LPTNNAADYSPTQNAVQVGGANGTLSSLSVGSTNSILAGATGAAPAFSTTANIYADSISFDSGANVLQNYVVSGTYSPVLSGGTTAGTTTYTVQAGSYTQIGKRVFVDVDIQYTAMTGTGAMHISLPTTPVSITNIGWCGSSYFSNVTLPTYVVIVLAAGTTMPVTARIAPGTSVIDFMAYESATAISTVAAGNPSSGTGQIMVSINYITT
jgi:hypothetical protein